MPFMVDVNIYICFDELGWAKINFPVSTTYLLVNCLILTMSVSPFMSGSFEGISRPKIVKVV